MRFLVWSAISAATLSLPVIPILAALSRPAAAQANKTTEALP